MQASTSARSAILRLGDPACGDPTQVGGKAANLSRLAVKHRVPAGFCLTAAAYRPDPPDAPLLADLQAELAAAYARPAWALKWRARPATTSPTAWPSSPWRPWATRRS